MKKFLKNKILTFAAVLLASCFWFFDASVHFFIYGEPDFQFLPTDFNELWMRSVIALLMVLFGVFGDYFTNHISSKDKLLELTCVYNDLMHANRDVLSNQLEQLKLFRVEARQSKDFDAEICKLFDNSISEISELVDSLTRVTDITDSQIKSELYEHGTHAYAPRLP